MGIHVPPTDRRVTPLRSLQRATIAFAGHGQVLHGDPRVPGRGSAAHRGQALSRSDGRLRRENGGCRGLDPASGHMLEVVAQSRRVRGAVETLTLSLGSFVRGTAAALCDPLRQARRQGPHHAPLRVLTPSSRHSSPVEGVGGGKRSSTDDAASRQRRGVLASGCRSLSPGMHKRVQRRSASSRRPPSRRWCACRPAGRQLPGVRGPWNKPRTAPPR